MHIGIDGKPLTIPYPCGVKHYTLELLHALSLVDTNNTYTIFMPHSISLPSYQNIRYSHAKAKLPWQMLLPHLIEKEHLDIFVNIHQHGSIFLTHKCIITTVLDVAPESSYPPIIQSPYYYMLGKYVSYIRHHILNKSKHLIAISNFTKSELIQYGYEKSNISVMHLGISQKFLIDKKKISRNYILSMADFSPRKNIITVIKAYALLPQIIKTKYKLVIIVSMPHILSKLNQMLMSYNVQRNAKIILQPSLHELIDCYDQSIVFCYPSLYEGFGLPILEAMARQCPVITSNKTATKEIAGDAAMLIDPNSPESLANAIISVANNQKLQHSLQKKGLARAQTFSWINTAKKFVEILTYVYQTKCRDCS